MKLRPSTLALTAIAFLAPACREEASPPPKPAAPKAAAPHPGAPAAPGEDEGLPPPPDVAGPPADAEKSASGLTWKVLAKGSGTEHPAKEDMVEVHYTGWTTDGKMFDSSVKRGEKAKFPLNRVIKGWTEGLQLMVTGEKRRFWIPVDLAYGGRPGKPAGTLVFDVELFGITKAPSAPDDVKAPPKDAKKTSSGLAWKLLSKGKGSEPPTTEDTVEIHYTGWKTDGSMIDSSVMNGQPARFPLKASRIKGWIEGLQLMVEGEKRRFWIPADLAFGDPPKQMGAPAGMLVYDIELLSIKKGPKPIPAPADVKAPPKDAKKTASGLAWKVLKKGTGTDHPGPTSLVEVHYTGWKTDGTMFDSSVMRGEPAKFPLNGVVKGWTEGMQLMVVGEKRRFWIPADLAYGDPPTRPGAPGGTLVFDIELLSIQ